ncbi:MAG: hypothetical protein LBE62_14160 [Azonexus sp.]|jgi:hypothetical protein|nr:hypothetical protein [Azonexus sp.]
MLVGGLLLIGCNPSPSVPSRSYVGMAGSDENWPYRYRVAQTNGVWSGCIERLDKNSWVFWDAMEIIYQREDQQITFKARSGEQQNIRQKWNILLGSITQQGFVAVLTDEPYGNQTIGLFFAPSTVTPNDSCV